MRTNPYAKVRGPGIGDLGGLSSIVGRWPQDRIPEASATMIHKANALSDVLQTISLGNDHLDAPTRKLGRSVLEEIAGLMGGEPNDR
jgi:hypothetical protein